MGALRLDILDKLYPGLKPVQGGLSIEEKTCAGEYMFGFNNQEKTNEVYGEGNAYDFGERMYDPRIGRWQKCDPLAAKYPYASPYSFALNSPLMAIDNEGKDVIVIIDWATTQGQSGHVILAVTTYESVQVQIDDKLETFWYATGVAYYQATDGVPMPIKGVGCH